MTTLKKQALKKLTLDTCIKTEFLFNNKFYQQKDGVNMGSSLVPVLANLITNEIEGVIIKPLISEGTIKFYSLFVDDTLLVIKLENVSKVHIVLNKFDKNLCRTVDMFQTEVPHFLYLELSPDGIKVFKKTQTLVYMLISRGFYFGPTSWIKKLLARASRICSTDKLPSQINTIKKFAKSVVDSIINETLNTRSVTEEQVIVTNQLQMEQVMKSLYIFVFLTTAIKVTNRIKKKEQAIVFRVLFELRKTDFFCSTKDRTETLH